MATVMLRQGRVRPVHAGHPNVYDGAIERVDGEPATGDEVDVADPAGRFVGRGIWNTESTVRVRVYSQEPGPLDDAWVARRIERAVRLRREVLRLDEITDAYRVVHGDGDGFPGLVVDRYRDHAVVMVTARGTADRRAAIAAALMEHLAVRGVWERAATSYAKSEGFHPGGGRLAGDAAPESVEVREGELRFAVDLREGAKTGHFLDQRDNRAAFAALCPRDARVLDLFSGTGGFGLAAARLSGAASVVAVDVSGRAHERLRANAALNGVADRVTAVQQDGFQAARSLEDAGRLFEAVCVDPPRFAVSRREIAGALRGYHELNLRAMRLVAPGGILATSSCTGVLSEAEFHLMLRDAAADAGRRVQVLRVSGQGPDHPWVTAAPEGRYLKHALARVL